jgi:hypothetical protein
MPNVGDYVRMHKPLEHFDGPCKILRVLFNTRLVIENAKDEVRTADQNEVYLCFEPKLTPAKRGEKK